MKELSAPLLSACNETDSDRTRSGTHLRHFYTFFSLAASSLTAPTAGQQDSGNMSLKPTTLSLQQRDERSRMFENSRLR